MWIALIWAVFQESAVERYLAEADKAARTRILAEIKEPIVEVERRLRQAPTRSDAGPRGQVVRRKLKPDHPAGAEFEYLLWVPRGYDPAKRGRLLVSLHGQSGTGDGHIGRWLPDVQPQEDLFLLCPSAGRGGWGRSLLGHAHALDPIREVLASYAIDPDQVFLDGASMGGNGSFELACTYPDRFAGVAPRSGGPMFRYVPTGVDKKDRTVTADYLENLVATPLYWVVGAKDAEVPNAWARIARQQLETLKIDFVYREYPDGGHEWFPQENAKVLEWMRERRRDPYPRRAAVHTIDRRFGRNYWIEVAEFRGKEIIKRGFQDLQGKTIEERLVFQDMIQVRGEILPESNEIKVSSTGAREVRIYLHEKMVDFARPVTVTVNGTRSRHDVKPSLETLLESARRDRGLLYTASVKVKVP